MNTSNASIGNGGTLIRGVTKAPLNAKTRRNEEARGKFTPRSFSMQFKLPSFLRSEAVGRDGAKLPGFENVELSQV
jgi:hypothetical protein